MRLDSVCDNEHAKRVCEVALAGSHSVMFIGAHDSQAKDLAMFIREQWTVMGRPYQNVYTVAPCPCGNYGSEDRECTCTPRAVTTWRNKHLPACSPDITVEVVRPQTHKLLAWVADGYRSGEPDEAVMARVENARNDSEIAMLDDTGMALLRAAIQHLQSGPKQVKSIISVATTIARLAGATSIHCTHLAEAIQYRPHREY